MKTTISCLLVLLLVLQLGMAQTGGTVDQEPLDLLIEKTNEMHANQCAQLLIRDQELDRLLRYVTGSKVTPEDPKVHERRKAQPGQWQSMLVPGEKPEQRISLRYRFVKYGKKEELEFETKEGKLEIPKAWKAERVELRKRAESLEAGDVTFEVVTFDALTERGKLGRPIFGVPNRHMRVDRIIDGSRVALSIVNVRPVGNESAVGIERRMEMRGIKTDDLRPLATLDKFPDVLLGLGERKAEPSEKHGRQVAVVINVEQLLAAPEYLQAASERGRAFKEARLRKTRD